MPVIRFCAGTEVFATNGSPLRNDGSIGSDHGTD
jgi:hypothetical protein